MIYRETGVLDRIATMDTNLTVQAMGAVTGQAEILALQKLLMFMNFCLVLSTTFMILKALKLGLKQKIIVKRLVVQEVPLYSFKMVPEQLVNSTIIFQVKILS